MLAPSLGQQAPAVADAADDLGRVVRVVGHQQPGARLLVPAEAGDAVVAAVQDAGLAGRRRRRQHGDPRVERRLAAADQPAEHRNPPGPDRLAQHGQAQPVDLDHEQPRDRLRRAPKSRATSRRTSTL